MIIWDEYQTSQKPTPILVRPMLLILPIIVVGNFPSLAMITATTN